MNPGIFLLISLCGTKRNACPLFRSARNAVRPFRRVSAAEKDLRLPRSRRNTSENPIRFLTWQNSPRQSRPLLPLPFRRPFPLRFLPEKDRTPCFRIYPSHFKQVFIVTKIDMGMEIGYT